MTTAAPDKVDATTVRSWLDQPDRITVLDQGRFLAEGTPADIGANAAVQAAYLGQAA